MHLTNYYKNRVVCNLWIMTHCDPIPYLGYRYNYRRAQTYYFNLFILLNKFSKYFCNLVIYNIVKTNLVNIIVEESKNLPLMFKYWVPGS